MRYAIIFAATAAASEAYGYGSHEEATSSSIAAYPSKASYGAYASGKSSSTVVYPSSKGGYESSTKVHGSSTMTPGYVSTSIKDYDNKYVTVTKTDQVITIYKTKSTKTHSATPTPTSYKKDDFMKVDCKDSAEYKGYSTDYKTACDKSVKYNSFPADCKSSAEYKGYSTEYKTTCDKSVEYKEWLKTHSGSSDNKSAEWYELYEKSYEASYKNLGPHAMAGYPGSGLRNDLEDHQPVHVREYKNGKWSEYDDDLKYGTPEEVKTYETVGVYTNPSKDVYVDHPITKGSEAYATAKAGSPVTYGGSYTEVAAPCTVTGAYGAYETGVTDGKTVTSTVVKYVTVFCPKAGKCEVAKPTTTVYDHDTEFAYPTPMTYAPGVYHYDAETVTITKPGQTKTCEYKQTKTYETTKETHSSSIGSDYYASKSSKTNEHPSYSTSTPAHGDHGHASSSKSVEYPSYATSTPVHGEKHSSSKSAEYPSYATSTPVHGEEYASTKSGDYPSYATSTPVHGEEYASTKSGDHPSHATSTPVHGEEYASTSSVPSYSTKTSHHEESSSPSATPSYENEDEDEYPTYDDAEESDAEEDDEEYLAPDNSTAPVELPTHDNTTAPVELPTHDNTTAPVELPTNDNTTAPVELPSNDNTTAPVEIPSKDNSTTTLPTDEDLPSDDSSPQIITLPSRHSGSISARALRAL